MKTPIDLGDSPEILIKSMSEDKKFYPTLHISGGEELVDFPEKGEMLVKFARSTRTVSEHGDDTRVSVGLEITCICEVTPEKGEAKSSSKSTSDALDKLMSEEEAASEDDDMEEGD